MREKFGTQDASKGKRKKSLGTQNSPTPGKRTQRKKENLSFAPSRGGALAFAGRILRTKKKKDISSVEPGIDAEIHFLERR